MAKMFVITIEGRPNFKYQVFAENEKMAEAAVRAKWEETKLLTEELLKQTLIVKEVKDD